MSAGRTQWRRGRRTRWAWAGLGAMVGALGALILLLSTPTAIDVVGQTIPVVPVLPPPIIVEPPGGGPVVPIPPAPPMPPAAQPATPPSVQVQPVTPPPPPPRPSVTVTVTATVPVTSTMTRTPAPTATPTATPTRTPTAPPMGVQRTPVPATPQPAVQVQPLSPVAVAPQPVVPRPVPVAVPRTGTGLQADRQLADGGWPLRLALGLVLSVLVAPVAAGLGRRARWRRGGAWGAGGTRGDDAR